MNKEKYEFDIGRLGYTSPKQLKEIISKFDNENEQLSFTFIVGSCFPRAKEGMDEVLKQVYTQGFIEGIKTYENQGHN